MGSASARPSVGHRMQNLDFGSRWTTNVPDYQTLHVDIDSALEFRIDKGCEQAQDGRHQ
jgi:hypothetical protein